MQDDYVYFESSSSLLIDCCDTCKFIEACLPLFCSIEYIDTPSTRCLQFTFEQVAVLHCLVLHALLSWLNHHMERLPVASVLYIYPSTYGRHYFADIEHTQSNAVCALKLHL